MIDAIKELFGSKKFLVMLAGLVVYLAGRFGFDIDHDALDRIIALVAAYITGQGIADAGKSAAQVTAASPAGQLTAPIQVIGKVADGGTVLL